MQSPCCVLGGVKINELCSREPFSQAWLILILKGVRDGFIARSLSLPQKKNDNGAELFLALPHSKF